MTDAKTEVATADEINFLAVVPDHKPALVLTDEDARKKLFEHIEKEVAEFVPDLTTVKGRDAIKSLAFKVVKTRTAVTAAAGQLTEAARKGIDAVNAERRKVEEKLKGLEDRVRAPLTEWETAEERRLAECDTALKRLTAIGVVEISATSAEVQAKLDEIKAFEIDPAKFLALTEPAEKAKAHSITLLESALERIRRQEEQEAELAALRADAEARRLADEARQREEREAQEAREAEERQAREAEEARQREEEAADARRRAEEERLAREEEERRAAAERAASEAREAAEQEAAAARETERLRHEEELAAERRRAEEAEQRENERLELEAAEQRRRAAAEADQARRRQVKTDAKEAIMTCGADEETAQKIVLAIVAGEVPRVRLDFAAEVAPPAETPAQPALV